MAISTTSNKRLLQLVSFATILLLLRRVNSQEVISVVFDGFDEYSELILQGDASYSSDRQLQLTKVDSYGNPLSNSVGRALYSQPVRLYDASNGRVASIHTAFVFNISSSSSNPPADGFTFFFASPDTTIPPGSDGAFLGLFSSANAINNSRNELIGFKNSPDSVVAVEFDTYPNVDLGDPNYQHIGIDVNSIVSVVTHPWDLENGNEIVSNVFYNPWAKTLRVTASYRGGSYTEFTHEIDLTSVLPEWVRVGFSASTGLYSQSNKVISWVYNSILDDVSAVNKGGIASVV